MPKSTNERTQPWPGRWVKAVVVKASELDRLIVSDVADRVKCGRFVPAVICFRVIKPLLDY